jgi:hypothetical protein
LDILLSEAKHCAHGAACCFTTLQYLVLLLPLIHTVHLLSIAIFTILAIEKISSSHNSYMAHNSYGYTVEPPLWTKPLSKNRIKEAV